MDRAVDPLLLRAMTHRYVFGMLLYILAFALAFFSAAASLVLIVILALIFVLPEPEGSGSSRRTRRPRFDHRNQRGCLRQRTADGRCGGELHRNTSADAGRRSDTFGSRSLLVLYRRAGIVGVRADTLQLFADRDEHGDGRDNRVQHDSADVPFHAGRRRPSVASSHACG